jgi:hypothetical protein
MPWWKAKKGDRLIDHPEVLEALTLLSFAAFPELGVASKLASAAIRVYVRMQIMEAIALEFAAYEIKKELPRKVTGDPSAPDGPAAGRRVQQRMKLNVNVPSGQDLHKQIQKAAVDGVHASLRRKGYSPGRSGNKFTVRMTMFL